MKIYVASSWRNATQPEVVLALRAAGHDVYDFRNPAPGDQGFGWPECATDEQLKDPRAFRDEVLTHPVATEAFAKDMNALRAADATVLVLPCGRSAHLELGWACGAGRPTCVLLDDPISEPELMHLMTTKICLTMDEVIRFLEGCERGVRHARVSDAIMVAERALRDALLRWRDVETAEREIAETETDEFLRLIGAKGAVSANTVARVLQSLDRYSK